MRTAGRAVDEVSDVVTMTAVAPKEVARRHDRHWMALGVDDIEECGHRWRAVCRVDAFQRHVHQEATVAKLECEKDGVEVRRPVSHKGADDIAIGRAKSRPSGGPPRHTRSVDARKDIVAR